MELWDAYDKDENKTGEDLIRGEVIPEGRYHLVCDVLVQHVDGDYLVMQRDLKKESCAGKFEATAGGSALKGENKEQCAKRELFEETGIHASNLQQISHHVLEHTIYYGFYTITACKKDKIILQKGETISYRWIPQEEIMDFVKSDDFIPSQYQRLRPFLEWTNAETGIEPMDDFFTERVNGYDEHMIRDVKGCKEAYEKIVDCLPKETKTLLDLGCGTGLELDAILAKYPDIKATGIDMTEAMLNALDKKHQKEVNSGQLKLICGSYFDVEFEKNQFDSAVSVQTMHHFSHERKIGLYKKICQSLKENGCYIECDYMVESQEEEDFYYNQNDKIRKRQQISEGEFYHYDTPCTIENQIKMLQTAGFKRIENVFRLGNTTILIAHKH